MEKTKQLILLVFFIAISSVSNGGEPALTADQLNTQGYRLYKKGELEESREKFRDAVRVNPHHVLALYNLACVTTLLVDKKGCMEAEDNYMGALAYLSRSIALDPARAKRATNDPDLVSLRDSALYQLITNLKTIKTDEDIKDFLVAFSWAGNFSELSGPYYRIWFDKNGSTIFKRKFWDEKADDWNFEEFSGKWRVGASAIIVEFDRPFISEKNFSGHVDNEGVLVFPSPLSKFDSEFGDGC